MKTQTRWLVILVLFVIVLGITGAVVMAQDETNTTRPADQILQVLHQRPDGKWDVYACYRTEYPGGMVVLTFGDVSWNCAQFMQMYLGENATNPWDVMFAR